MHNLPPSTRPSYWTDRILVGDDLPIVLHESLEFCRLKLTVDELGQELLDRAYAVARTLPCQVATEWTVVTIDGELQYDGWYPRDRLLAIELYVSPLRATAEQTLASSPVAG